LKERLENGLKITVYHIDTSEKELPAFKYIDQHRPSHDALASPKSFERTVCEILGFPEGHKKVLRYAFVYSLEFAWIKLYPNYLFNEPHPAFKLKKSSLLFDLVEREIEELTKDA